MDSVANDNKHQENKSSKPQKTDFMEWCIKNGKMDESKLEATLSTPQTKHTESRK